MFNNSPHPPKFVPFFYTAWEKYGRAGQTTDDNIIWRMRLACSVTKNTNTHSEYLIIFLIHGNNGFNNAPHCHAVRTLSATVTYCCELHAHTA